MEKQIEEDNNIQNENNNMDKAELFNKELKELLVKYNAEIYAESKGDGWLRFHYYGNILLM